MDVAQTYAELLCYFLALLVVGVSLKFRLVKPHNQHPIVIKGKTFYRHQMVGLATVIMLGVVIQVVADSVKYLQGISLFQDPIVGGGFVVAFMILITAR